MWSKISNQNRTFINESQVPCLDPKSSSVASNGQRSFTDISTLSCISWTYPDPFPQWLRFQSLVVTFASQNCLCPSTSVSHVTTTKKSFGWQVTSKLNVFRLNFMEIPARGLSNRWKSQKPLKNIIIEKKTTKWVGSQQQVK